MHEGSRMPVLVRVPHEGPRSSERALSLVLSSSVQNGTRPKEANACHGKIYSKHAHMQGGRLQNSGTRPKEVNAKSRFRAGGGKKKGVAIRQLPAGSDILLNSSFR